VRLVGKVGDLDAQFRHVARRGLHVRQQEFLGVELLHPLP